MIKEFIKICLFLVIIVSVWLIGLVMGYNLCPFS